MRPGRAGLAAALIAAAVAGCGVSMGSTVTTVASTTTAKTHTRTHAVTTTTASAAGTTVTVAGGRKHGYNLAIAGSAIAGPYVGNYLRGVPNISDALIPARPDATAQAIAGFLIIAGAKINENQATCKPATTRPALTYNCVVGNSTDSSDVTATLVPVGG